MNNSPYMRGLGFAFLTMLVSGVAVFTNGIAVKGLDPLVHTTVKNSLVGIALLLLVLVKKDFRKIVKYSLKQWLTLLSIGVLGGGIPFALFFIGLKATGAVPGALIHKTLIFWLLILAVPLLKEKASGKLLIGALLLYASNFFVPIKGLGQLGMGHLMVLGATLFWAVENVIVKRVTEHFSTTELATARMVIGSLVLVGITVALGKGPLLFTLTTAQLGLTSLTALFLGLYVLTWYKALKHAPATHVASILVGATVITSLLTAAFTDKTLDITTLSQAMVITAGIGFVVMSGFEPKLKSSTTDAAA